MTDDDPAVWFEWGGDDSEDDELAEAVAQAWMFGDGNEEGGEG